MDPVNHVIVSATVGGIFWFFTKNLAGAILVFMPGVFVDIDHIIEYFLHYGFKKFSLGNIYRTCLRTHRGDDGQRFHKLYLVFHSWEIVIFLGLVTAASRNIYILAFTLGCFTHMLMDSIGNRFYPSSYFFTQRVLKGFDTDKLFKRNK